ncbi:hypothetical protein CBS101457_000283 [Exobasidium rhododendri]|nr:hypothetical protein CBS101457_000283 [Exobasidium rhododendri]
MFSSTGVSSYPSSSAPHQRTAEHGGSSSGSRSQPSLQEIAAMIDLGFPWDKRQENMPCWNLLSKALQDLLIKIIIKETAFEKRATLPKVALIMTPKLAVLLLSGVDEYKKQAFDAIYPIKTRRYCVDWKGDLPEPAADALVHALCVASGQEEEVIRSHLSRQKVSSDLALALFNTTDPGRRAYVEDNGLVKDHEKAPRIRLRHEQIVERDANVISPTSSKYKPWMHNTTAEQREQVIEILKSVFGYSDSYILRVLKKDRIKSEHNLGLRILETAARPNSVDDVKELVTEVTGLQPHKGKKRGSP